MQSPDIVSAARSGAVRAANDMIDADLAKIITAWPNLRPDVKAAVLALIGQQGGDV